MPLDYIDLTRPFGADEPLLVCPACTCPLNDRAPGPEEVGRRSLLLANRDFDCPACGASLMIAIIARPDQPGQWTVLKGVKLLQRGQLSYATDLEQAIAAMQKRYLTHTSLEDLAEWVRSAGYLRGHTDARRAARLLRHKQAWGVYRVAPGLVGDGHPPVFRRAYPQFVNGRLWNAAQRKLCGLAYRRPDGRWMPGHRQPIGLFQIGTPRRCGHCGEPALWSSSGRGWRIECQHRRRNEPCIRSTRDTQIVNEGLTSGFASVLRRGDWTGQIAQDGWALVRRGRRRDPANSRPPWADEDAEKPVDHLASGKPEGATSPPAPYLKRWLAELQALRQLDLPPAERSRRARLLERNQWPAIRKCRLRRLKRLGDFPRAAAVFADQLERGLIAPHRLTKVVVSFEFREVERPGRDPVWEALVELDPRQILFLVDPAGWSVGLPMEGWRAERHTFPIDRPPLRETKRAEVLHLYQNGNKSQRQIAAALDLSQSTISGILDGAPDDPPQQQRPPRGGRRSRRGRDEQFAELLSQQSAIDRELDLEWAPGTADGDRRRRTLIRQMVANVVRGGVPRPDKGAFDFSAAVRMTDDLDLDPTGEPRPMTFEQHLARLVDPPPAALREPASTPDPDRTVMARATGLLPGRIVTLDKLDQWARLGLDHIPKRTSLGPFPGLAADYPWQVALDAHLSGRPVAGAVGGAAPTVRDAVRVLQDHDRGKVRVACPLGGALWLRGKQDLETALVEARIYSGQSSRILESHFSYPCDWFDVYRMLLFSAPPRTIPWRQIAASKLTVYEAFRQLLLNVAQQGADRLERFVTGLVQHGHLRGGQRFTIPRPSLGRAELANYELMFQACWLRPTDDNERFLFERHDRLHQYAHRRRQKVAKEDSAGPTAAQLHQAHAVLEQEVAAYFPEAIKPVTQTPDSPEPGVLSTLRPLRFE
jgi:hypothetical protein